MANPCFVYTCFSFPLRLKHLSLMSPLGRDLRSYEFYHLSGRPPAPLSISLFTISTHPLVFLFTSHPLAFPYRPSPIHLPTRSPPTILLIVHTPAYLFSVHPFVRTLASRCLPIHPPPHPFTNHPRISHISTNANPYSSKYHSPAHPPIRPSVHYSSSLTHLPIHHQHADLSAYPIIYPATHCLTPSPILTLPFFTTIRLPTHLPTHSPTGPHIHPVTNQPWAIHSSIFPPI